MEHIQWIGKTAHSRAQETNHDIAVILKENSVKLPAGETARFGDILDDLVLNFFVVSIQRTSLDLDSYCLKDSEDPAV